MPRAQGSIPAQSLKPAALGRTKKVVLVGGGTTARNFFPDTAHRPDVKETCPLCIEELDETDKDFYPCPCGYQVCVFCYGRVQDLCKNMCPGCRREYGQPVEAPLVRHVDDRAADSEPDNAPPAATVAAKPAHRLSGNGAHGSQAMAPAAQTPRSPANPATRAQQQRRTAMEQVAGARHREDASAATAASAGLPTGATWAAPSVSRLQPADVQEAPPQPQQQPLPPAASQQAVDESAWPSLGSAVPAAPPSGTPSLRHMLQLQPPQQLRHEYSNGSSVDLGAAAKRGRQYQHERSDSVASSASADGATSQSSHSSRDMQADQHVPPQLVDAFATAQVSSLVYGTRHTVNVPLNGGGGGGRAGAAAAAAVEVLPEAAAMRAGMQRDLAAGAISSREAAARLVALLKQQQPQQQQQQQQGGAASRAPAAAGAAAPAAARAPPPGFSGAAVSVSPPPGFGGVAAPQQPQPPQQATPSSSFSFLNQQDPSVPGPPLGRYLPIQPPVMHPQIHKQALGGGGLLGPSSLFSAAPGSGRAPAPPPSNSLPQHRPPYDPPLTAASGSGGLQQQQQQQPSLFGGYGGGGGGRSYSMWSCLPGIDLGVAPSWGDSPGPSQASGGDLRASYGSPLLQSAASAPGGLDGHAGGGGGSFLQASPLLAGGPAKSPPPGFGPALPVAGAPGDAAVKGRPYLPMGVGSTALGGLASAGGGGLAGYNPLQAARVVAPPPGLARGPPPGMAAYRPPLGSGM